MNDTFRETRAVSWSGRLKRSVTGFGIGVLLIAGMVFLLFWNEGRAVQTARSLAEGAGAVVSVPAGAADPVNDGSLIHVSGPLTATDVPVDPSFGVSMPSVRLVRKVEMYQWIETSKSETETKLGGSEETVVTYSYAKQWDDAPRDSAAFKQPAGHTNPPMNITGRQFQVPEARLGGFTLGEAVLDRIQGAEDLLLGPEQASAVQAAFAGAQKVSLVDGRIYLGENPSVAPAIGDYRIGYQYVPLGVVSVIGQQAGAAFQPYQTRAGNQLLMVDRGSVPADRMFAEAATANTLVTWLLRLVGVLLLALGFSLLLAPLGVLADVVPFVGGMVRFGTGLIGFLLAVLLGTATIALAWFYYRPLLALGIAVLGIVAAAGIVYLGRRRGTPRVGKAPSSASAPASATPSSRWN